MIAAIQINVVRINDTGDADQQKHFDTLETSIDQITVENVRIFIRWKSVLKLRHLSFLCIGANKEPFYFVKNQHQIGQTAVQIADDGDRS